MLGVCGGVGGGSGGITGRMKLKSDFLCFFSIFAGIHIHNSKVYPYRNLKDTEEDA